MNCTVFTAIKLPDEVYEYYWRQQTAHEGLAEILGKIVVAVWQKEKSEESLKGKKND